MKGEQKYSEVVKDCHQTLLLVQGPAITLKLVYDHVHLPKFQCTWQTREIPKRDLLDVTP